MNVLVVGAGAREHALAWKLAQSPRVARLYAAPGNPGIEDLGECLPMDASDPAQVAALAEKLGADLTVIGPEVPLVGGVADELIARGLPVFGPTRAAARIEGSKAWAKEVLEAAGAPVTQSRPFTTARDAVAFLDRLAPPFVIKADGLAAGKGVAICETRAEAVVAIEERLVERRFGDAGSTVVVEEFLHGEELSLFCLSDGRALLPLAEAQDYKRALDGDSGPNTGGMGAYSPVPRLGASVQEAVEQIMRPVIREMEQRGAPFVGLLYGGLMITSDGPRLIEFNCRFGDPETQVVLPRLDADLAALLESCVGGTLATQVPAWSARACVSVVLASAGYPGEYQTGREIRGLDRAGGMEDVMVFHAGTARRGDAVVTAGGRVLAVSALGDGIAEARARAYDAAERIEFEGKYARTDIAARAAAWKEDA